MGADEKVSGWRRGRRGGIRGVRERNRGGGDVKGVWSVEGERVVVVVGFNDSKRDAVARAT